ncbi:alpha/beta fold hydrolase [Magnetospirillum sulfuroxidans]|uniref:Alpha/beta hydrolase n=1 Tax=Magnetospirillum sulfuroxidans TaxID=611300 RepID=A0ABS5IB72_9PROT|nr:alpha/beta hydrolase [Magnetospirillum sulfuroxidans]MBR9971382.1 alpha/beta hydrolase [Magnetospirillum sulfuroxidans]
MRLVFRLLLILVLLAPAAALAKDGQSRFAGTDGVLVHYKSWGKGSPVILIHGFTLNQSFWRLQVPELAKAHQVIALDLPGHGQSGKPRDTVYDMDFYARAVEAVAKDAGLDHAALIGHSMGLPVIHTVMRHGVLKVDKAVFVDGAILAQPSDPAAKAAQQAWMKSMIEGLNSPGYQLVLEQFFQRFSTKVSPKQKQELMTTARAIDQSVAVSTFTHFSDDAVWAPAHYDIPVLGLYAAASQTGVKEWLAMNYPKAKLVVWDDVDHFPQLTQPQRVNQALVAFLR